MRRSATLRRGATRKQGPTGQSGGEACFERRGHSDLLRSVCNGRTAVAPHSSSHLKIFWFLAMIPT